MKTLGVAVAALVVGVVSPALVAAQDRIEGTVISTTLTSCEFKPGTCEGSLVLDTKGKDGQVTVKVPKGTPITKGHDHVFLPSLKGRRVAIAYANDGGQKVARSIEVQSSKP